MFVLVCSWVIYVWQKYFKNADTGATAASPVNAVSPAAGGLTDVQQQMVQQFCVQSGMNAAWSARYQPHHLTAWYLHVQTYDYLWQQRGSCVDASLSIYCVFLFVRTIFEKVVDGFVWSSTLVNFICQISPNITVWNISSWSIIPLHWNEVLFKFTIYSSSHWHRSTKFDMINPCGRSEGFQLVDHIPT